MTKLHRRPSSGSQLRPTGLARAGLPGLGLSLGLGLLVSLAATPSWAAPPDEGEGDAEVEAPAEEAPAEQPEPETEVEAPAPILDHAPMVEGEEQAAPEEEEPPPPEVARPTPSIGDKHSIQYTNLLAPRINPLGLENRLWIGYQYRLYNKQKTILDGSNIGIFFRPILSPAIALIGATLQVQPAAVLRLRATYSYLSYFGTFQFLQSFQSPHDDFSETRLRTLADEGRNYVTSGHQVELEALIRARYKGLVLRSTTVADYNIMNLRGDDDVYYDIRVDAMVPNNGWVLFNDTDLFWLHDIKKDKRPSVIAGMRASVVAPFYPKSVYEPGDVPENPNGPQFRIGPEVGYIFYDRADRPRFNKPTLLLIPQWNVIHRWRAGRDVSPVYPTIVAAFVFQGQLWGKN
ncbi:MAG: hypothetical protein R6X02_17005 [Enhygromyxa sp.]